MNPALVKSIEFGSLVTAILFGGALLGMLAHYVLPERHLSGETKSLISVSTAVIGTLSALVLGLLLSTASTSFAQRNLEVMLRSSQKQPRSPESVVWKDLRSYPPSQWTTILSRSEGEE
jgi:hypothetical protein